MGTIADKLAYTKQARDEITQAIIAKGVDCPSDSPFCTFDEYIAQIQTGSDTPDIALVNYHYWLTSDSTSHSRTYSGKAGNMLLLLLLHRGALVTHPDGWEHLGTLAESGDANVDSVTYVQYLSIYKKTCIGDESLSYEQEESNMSITCFMEFENAKNFLLMENTRQENVGASQAITCASRASGFIVWVTNALYFVNNSYTWQVSDGDIWQLSTDTAQPRAGVFVDTRLAKDAFTISSGMTGTPERYVSAIGIRVTPKK